MRTDRAVVAGASSDIGSGIAVDLARLGYDLVLWGRDDARLQACAQTCSEAGVAVETARFDVRDRSALSRAAEAATEGGLTAFVWAAGIFDWAAPEDADPARWDDVLDVNLAAAAFAVQRLSAALVRQPSAVVLIASAAARSAFANNAAYVASKHGLLGLAQSLFLDLRDKHVKVSAVCPGLLDAGAGLLSPAGQSRPEHLLHVSDVVAAVRFVITSPVNCCPTEIVLQPQLDPDHADFGG